MWLDIASTVARLKQLEMEGDLSFIGYRLVTCDLPRLWRHLPEYWKDAVTKIVEQDARP